jgi:hypothetical protein
MFLVGFNGPPRCGKDTMARMLADHMDSQGVTIPVREVSLSTPLRVIAYAMTGFKGALDGDDYEGFKIKWFREFDRTGRELMIDVSEKFLKPVYGPAIMADLLLGQLQGFTGVALIRDTGFQVELESLAKRMGFRKIYCARIHRDGCDFSNDSREYVTHPFAADYENNGSLDDLRVEAGRIYGRLVNQMGWAL